MFYLHRLCLAIGARVKDSRKSSEGTPFPLLFLNKATATDAFYISLRALENLQCFPWWKTPRFSYRNEAGRKPPSMAQPQTRRHTISPWRIGVSPQRMGLGRQGKHQWALHGLDAAQRTRASRCPCHTPGPQQALWAGTPAAVLSWVESQSELVPGVRGKAGGGCQGW